MSPKLSRITAFLNVFALDIRSLALFRVGIAILILWDYAIRFQDLKLFYSDSGVLPRTALTADPQFSASLISLHLASGSATFQALLFLAGVIAALALLLGYQTRLATFISWLLLASLQSRTPLLMQGDDAIRRLCLFWSIFVPLGASYSLDSALARYPIAKEEPVQPPKLLLSWATAGFILQLVFIYVFNALAKSDAIWHEQATALYYTLQIDYFVRPLGHLLAAQTWLLPWLSRTTVPFELYVPLLLFIPWTNAGIRMALIAIFTIFHLGIALTLTIGIFSASCIVFWLALLPGSFWDFWTSIATRRGWRAEHSLRGFFDSDCGFCRRMVGIVRELFGLPASSFGPAQTDPEIQAAMEQRNSWVVRHPNGQLQFGFDGFVSALALSPLRFWLPRSITRATGALLRKAPISRAGNRIYRWIAEHRVLLGGWLARLQPAPAYFHLSKFGQLIAALSLLYIAAWNIRVLRHPLYGQNGQVRWYDRPGVLLRLDQKWTMFAPYPATNDGWYVITGTCNNGTKVNLLHPGVPITWEKPPRLETSFGNYRRRQYIVSLAFTKYARYRLWFARYLRRRWNEGKTKPSQLRQIKIYFVLEPTPPPESRPKSFPVLMHSYNCTTDTGETLPSGIDWEPSQIRAAQKRLVPVR